MREILNNVDTEKMVFGRPLSHEQRADVIFIGRTLYGEDGLDFGLALGLHVIDPECPVLTDKSKLNRGKPVVISHEKTVFDNQFGEATSGIYCILSLLAVMRELDYARPALSSLPTTVIKNDNKKLALVGQKVDLNIGEERKLLIPGALDILSIMKSQGNLPESIRHIGVFVVAGQNGPNERIYSALSENDKVVLQKLGKKPEDNIN
jgi:hypothetical protein